MSNYRASTNVHVQTYGPDGDVNLFIAEGEEFDPADPRLARAMPRLKAGKAVAAVTRTKAKAATGETPAADADTNTAS